LRERVQLVEPPHERHSVLPSEQIPVTSDGVSLSSHSYDILDNCMAVPSSEQDNHVSRPDHSNEPLSENIATPVGVINFPFNLGQ
jgi:hypothetical protein